MTPPPPAALAGRGAWGSTLSLHARCPAQAVLERCNLQDDVPGRGWRAEPAPPEYTSSDAMHALFTAARLQSIAGPDPPVPSPVRLVEDWRERCEVRELAAAAAGWPFEALTALQHTHLLLDEWWDERSRRITGRRDPSLRMARTARRAGRHAAAARALELMPEDVEGGPLALAWRVEEAKLFWARSKAGAALAVGGGVEACVETKAAQWRAANGRAATTDGEWAAAQDRAVLQVLLAKWRARARRAVVVGVLGRMLGRGKGALQGRGMRVGPAQEAQRTSGGDPGVRGKAPPPPGRSAHRRLCLQTRTQLPSGSVQGVWVAGGGAGDAAVGRGQAAADRQRKRRRRCQWGRRRRHQGPRRRRRRRGPACPACTVPRPVPPGRLRRRPLPRGAGGAGQRRLGRGSGGGTGQNSAGGRAGGGAGPAWVRAGGAAEAGAGVDRARP